MSSKKTVKSYIVAICSSKGGVGKTTFTANFGGFLSDLGLKVLLVDADKQPSLSSYYPLETRSKDGFLSLLLENNIQTTVSRATVGCDIVINDDNDDQLSNWIIHTPDGRVRLKFLLQRLQNQNNYDIILIDTQGAIGPLQDIGVLAADFSISPIMPETISAREFSRGTVALIDRLSPMATMGAPLGPLNGLINRKDRTQIAQLIEDELRKLQYNPVLGNIRILDTAVPSLSTYPKAATAQIPVHRYESSRSGPTASALQTMAAITKEVFPHLSKTIDRKFMVQGVKNNDH